MVNTYGYLEQEFRKICAAIDNKGTPKSHRIGKPALQYFWQRNLFLRGCRVPSKIRFTAKHLTVLGLFGVHLQNVAPKKKRKEKRKGKKEKKRRKEKKKKKNRGRRLLTLFSLLGVHANAEKKYC